MKRLTIIAGLLLLMLCDRDAYARIVHCGTFSSTCRTEEEEVTVIANVSPLDIMYGSQFGASSGMGAGWQQGPGQYCIGRGCGLAYQIDEEDWCRAHPNSKRCQTSSFLDTLPTLEAAACAMAGGEWDGVQCVGGGGTTLVNGLQPGSCGEQALVDLQRSIDREMLLQAHLIYILEKWADNSSGSPSYSVPRVPSSRGPSRPPVQLTLPGRENLLSKRVTPCSVINEFRKWVVHTSWLTQTLRLLF